jgi:hypothetical protein
LAEKLAPPRQTFGLVREDNPDVDLTQPSVTAGDELAAKWRLGGTGEFLRWGLLQQQSPPDPNFISWNHMQGHEEFADWLAPARSQGEFDAILHHIDQNRRDRITAENGPMGIVGDLMAGIADPANLIPIPVVKGIGLIRGALVFGAAAGAIGAGEEYLRQKSDPLARPEEAFLNIGLSAVLGGLIGAPLGAWGHGEVRRARAIRAMEGALSDPDNPNFSLKPRSLEGIDGVKYERPPPNHDGSYSRFKVVDDVSWEPRAVDGVRYVSEDGIGWVRAAEAGGRAEPLSVSDDIAEQLGRPTPVTSKILYVDEMANKAEYQRGQWHDELARYVEDDTPVERIILDDNDFSNFRTFEHGWEKALPRAIDETAQAWRDRVGKAAMGELRASKVSGAYAGPQGIAWVMERLNFSPVAKLIRAFAGDNYVADLALRIGGDSGWAIKANQFGWSTPPSILLKSMQHTARYLQWKGVFEAEWLKLASDNQQAKGRVFQGLNVSAAAYAKVAGARRMAGARVLTHGDFEEMVAEAVFREGHFEVNGFPVNENARRAAKAFTEMAQEYDDLHRAAGNFRDQKRLAQDIKFWGKARTRYQDSLMRWLWGETGQPASLRAAIRVMRRPPGQLLEGGELHVFEGATHEEAIQKMVDELGDEGITLSENLTPDSYGYTYGDAGARRTDTPASTTTPLSGTPEIPPDASGVPPPATPIAGDAAVRAEAEQAAELNRLKSLIDSGEATPEDIAAHKVLDRIMLQRAMKDFDLRGKSMATHADYVSRFIRQDDPALIAITPRPYPAVMYKGEVFVGEEHIDAVREAIAKYPEFEKILDEDPDPYIGYVRQPDYYPGKSMAAYGVDQFAYNPDLKNFHSVGEVLSYFKETVDDPDYRALIDRIHEDVGDTPIHVVDRADVDPNNPRHVALQEAIGRFLFKEHEVFVRGDWGDLASGTNPEVVLHEALHGATGRRISAAQAYRKLGVANQYTRVLDELEAFHANLQARLKGKDAEAMFAGMDLSTRQNLRLDLEAMTGDIHEVTTYALTHKPIRDWLKTQPADAPGGWIRTKYDELLALVARLFGFDKPTVEQVSMIDRLMGITDRFVDLEQPLRTGETRPGFSRLAHEGEPFVTVADAMEQRVRALSPAQRAIYEERAASLRMAEDNLAKAEADLRIVTEQPHEFLNAAGKREPWYHRVWDKAKSATEREQLTRLIQKWYERDHPDGARARAEETVDHILNGDEEIGDAAGMSALGQRRLNIPNSWSIEDAEFGTVKVSDFIDKRILSVGEHYVHRSGVKIETARMFGDSEMRAAKAELREYLMKRYYEPAVGEPARRAALARVEEGMGWLDIIHKSVSGTLRTTDPWRLDNRIAAAMQNVTTLGVMGKVAVASLGEIFRPGMVNGYGTYFRTIFSKYLDDLEALRPNMDLLDKQLAHELNDLSMNRMHVQQAVIQDGEPALGGTTVERWLSDRTAGLYKITGLTSLTTWQKIMAGLAAQHSVMNEARLVGEAAIAGTRPDPAAVLRLGAMGISIRDAVLLSKMPVQHYQGGMLIMPAVDQWQHLGAEGRQARALLVNALHAEMRRTIVTPSIGDVSTVFKGVWTSKGKVKFQSDLLMLPMQFLSYGMGAHNKLLTSAIQGRDRSTAMGLFYTYLSGIFAAWLLADEQEWRRKTYDQVLADGFDRSGIGGFWFNGLNAQIERASNSRLGLRRLVGIEPDFKPDPQRNVTNAIGAAGAAPGYFADLSRAFWDTSVTGSQRARIIRRGIPYNNVFWWSSVFDTMANEAADAIGEKR